MRLLERSVSWVVRVSFPAFPSRDPCAQAFPNPTTAAILRRHVMDPVGSIEAFCLLFCLRFFNRNMRDVWPKDGRHQQSATHGEIGWRTSEGKDMDPKPAATAKTMCIEVLYFILDELRPRGTRVELGDGHCCHPVVRKSVRNLSLMHVPASLTGMSTRSVRSRYPGHATSVF